MMPPKSTGYRKIALLCDFDGTICLFNVQMRLYEIFADPATRVINERWDRGEISTKEELEGCFSSITASKEEMQSFFDTVPLDPNLHALLEYSRKNRIFAAVLSDGLKWYIDYILLAHGIEHIPVYANDIIFTDRSHRFHFPWYDPSSPLRGTSKNKIIRKFKENGYFVIFVGDGLSDTDAVKDADFIFAKDYLLTYVRSNQIPACEYEDLSDMLEQFKELTVKLRAE